VKFLLCPNSYTPFPFLIRLPPQAVAPRHPHPGPVKTEPVVSSEEATSKKALHLQFTKQFLLRITPIGVEGRRKTNYIANRIKFDNSKIN